MVLFTSYYGNIKNLPKDSILVSISKGCPDIPNVHRFVEVAPSKELLDGYKSGKYSKNDYIRIYNKQLFEYAPQKWLDKLINFLLSDGVETVDLSKIVLLCYEKYKDKDGQIQFCHRHLFANYINTQDGWDVCEYNGIQCRLLISGTREEVEDKDALYRCIKYGIIKLKRKYPNLLNENIEIVQGGAKGVDTLAKKFAKKYGFKCTQFDADWDTYGKSAGFRRNSEMAEYIMNSEVYFLIAFPQKDGESKGTWGMIELAEKKSIPRIICEISTIPFK